MPKTVKVRIAVAVDPSGDWNACGFKGAKSDKEMMDYAIEVLEDSAVHYFLEAELEIPEIKTIQARVEREPHGN